MWYSLPRRFRSNLARDALANRIRQNRVRCDRRRSRKVDCSRPVRRALCCRKTQRRTCMRLIWECSFDALLDSDRKMRDAGHRGGSESTQLGECVV